MPLFSICLVVRESVRGYYPTVSVDTGLIDAECGQRGIKVATRFHLSCCPF